MRNNAVATIAARKTSPTSNRPNFLQMPTGGTGFAKPPGPGIVGESGITEKASSEKVI
jgi:hypothetical protein